MIPEHFSFLSILWLEFLGVSIAVVLFLIATIGFKHLQLVELKFGAGLILVTVGVAIFASNTWDAGFWHAFLYAFGAMYVAAIPWAIILTLIYVIIEKIRDP